MPDITLGIFILTYVGMAIGRIPGLRTDRAGLAAIAAILMIVVNGADLRRATGWVDFPTLALLFGLMVLSGLFGISASTTIAPIASPTRAVRRSGCSR
jgi:hypothetical protein